MKKKIANLIYRWVLMSMAIVCSYYAGQLDQLYGTLTFQMLTEHLYTTVISFYGGTEFEEIVWILWMLSVGCWIRAFRTDDRIDNCEIAISMLAFIFSIINFFLPSSQMDFWTGNVAYAILVIDFFVILGYFYHGAWKVVSNLHSPKKGRKKGKKDTVDTDSDSAVDQPAVQVNNIRHKIVIPEESDE